MKFGRVLFAAFAVIFLLAGTSARAQEEAAVAADASAHHAEEGGSSMPQLDPTYYPSQLFWLAVTGVLLYLIMSRVALPGVSRMVERRDAQVRADLEQAYKLKQHAEDIKIAYMRQLRDADERSKTLVDKTTRDLKDKQAKSLDDSVIRINQKLKEAEQYIRGEKDALVNEAPLISERLAKAVMKELKEAA